MRSGEERFGGHRMGVGDGGPESSRWNSESLTSSRPDPQRTPFWFLPNPNPLPLLVGPMVRRWGEGCRESPGARVKGRA